MIVLGVEVIGDVTATAEVSRIETAGPKQRRRIKGALLADGFNCLLAACAMTLPVTTFAQNNGVINITRCASRMAGLFCGGWLILLGIIAPVSTLCQRSKTFKRKLLVLLFLSCVKWPSSLVTPCNKRVRTAFT